MRRTFKEFESMWEDAAANSVGGGGVSMPADAINLATNFAVIGTLEDLGLLSCRA